MKDNTSPNRQILQTPPSPIPQSSSHPDDLSSTQTNESQVQIKKTLPFLQIKVLLQQSLNYRIEIEQISLNCKQLFHQCQQINISKPIDIMLIIQKYIQKYGIITRIISKHSQLKEKIKLQISIALLLKKDRCWELLFPSQKNVVELANQLENNHQVMKRYQLIIDNVIMKRIQQLRELSVKIYERQGLEVGNKKNEGKDQEMLLSELYDKMDMKNKHKSFSCQC